jgi:hypothetical protein
LSLPGWLLTAAVAATGGGGGGGPAMRLELTMWPFGLGVPVRALESGHASS